MPVKTALLSFFVSVFLLQAGCSSFRKPETEGIIEYNIKYDEKQIDNVMKLMAPSSISVKFKNNLTRTEMKVGVGIMVLSLISNPDKKTVTTLFQVIDKKYAMVSDSLEVDGRLVKKYPPLRVEYVKGTKKIAGYSCEKAIIHEVNGRTYPVYFTREIKIKKPNWNSPYKDIDGVLMEFPVKNKEIEMLLTATRVAGQPILDTEFVLPKDFKVVKNEDMPEIFKTQFE